jgi:hypothetical protein
MEKWYNYYTNCHNEIFPYYYISAYNILPIFHYTLWKKEEIISKKELLQFYSISKLSKNRKLELVSEIVFQNILQISIDNLKIQHNIIYLIEEWKYELNAMMEFTRQSVNIMNYLLEKYDFVYIQKWRNKDVIINSYVLSSVKFEKECLILFKTYNSIDDLINLYSILNQISYNGLLITTYIRLINNDILEQMYYCNEIHIFNISEDLFE